MRTTKEEYLLELNKVLLLQREESIVSLNEIPTIFKDDFNHFIMGETLHRINGEIVVGVKTYCQWVEKIKNIGLDYEVQLENS